MKTVLFQDVSLYLKYDWPYVSTSFKIYVLQTLLKSIMLTIVILL